MSNVGGLVRHYGFHLLVLLTGGGVAALQRHLEPGTWMVLVVLYVGAVCVGLVALIRHARTERPAGVARERDEERRSAGPWRATASLTGDCVRRDVGG